jgi:ribosomal protein L15
MQGVAGLRDPAHQLCGQALGLADKAGLRFGVHRQAGPPAGEGAKGQAQQQHGRYCPVPAPPRCPRRGRDGSMTRRRHTPL